MELLNPVVVAEVTSPSSIEYDRGEKREFYFDVPSIQAYLIVDQHRVCAELCTRAEGGWQTQSFTSVDEVVPLDALNCDLPLSQVYRGISFDPQPD